MSSSQSSLSLTTRTNGRKTSAQAQAGRQNDMDITNLTKIAYKVGTLLLDSVQKNKNPLTNFSSADKVTFKVNEMLGVDLVSGRQLQNGMKDDRVGKLPPQRGPEAAISKEEFEALANLVFTAELIEQANCAERTDRQQMMSIVGDIISTH
jgi:hypothetical protein